MKNVLVIGSTCVDVIIRVDHLPKTEENLHPYSQRFAIGGCAYNAANILGRGGAKLTFVTPTTMLPSPVWPLRLPPIPSLAVCLSCVCTPVF